MENGGRGRGGRYQLGGILLVTPRHDVGTEIEDESALLRKETNMGRQQVFGTDLRRVWAGDGVQN